jgi:hypothetical protein
VIYTARLVRDGDVRRGSVDLGIRGVWALTMRLTGQDTHGTRTADLGADGVLVLTLDDGAVQRRAYAGPEAA